MFMHKVVGNKAYFSDQNNSCSPCTCVSADTHCVTHNNRYDNKNHHYSTYDTHHNSPFQIVTLMSNLHRRCTALTVVTINICWMRKEISMAIRNGLLLLLPDGMMVWIVHIINEIGYLGSSLQFLLSIC